MAKFKDLISVYGNIDMSNGIPKGTVYYDRPRLGTVCRKLEIQYAPAFVGFINRKPQTKGILIPYQSRKKLDTYLSTYDSKKSEREKKNERKRIAKQKREIREFTQEIIHQFPNIKKEEAREIAERSVKTGSGNVGRCTNLYLEERVYRAVIAHIRHTYTNYDLLLHEGTHKDDARVEVSQEIFNIVKKLKEKA